MAENPSQPEGDASAQDMDLEAQLDQLLGDLEAVEPEAVPADLRKQKPVAKPVAATPLVPDPVTEPVTEEAQPEPAPAPVQTEVASEGEAVEAVAQAADENTTPATNGPGLDADTIAAMAADLLNAQIDSTIEAASVNAEPEAPIEAVEASPVAEAAQPEPVPTAVESSPEPEPEPITPISEDDLASQLDTLLTQVQNPGAVTAEPSAEAPVSEAVEPTAVEASDVPEAGAEASTESDAPKTVASLSEDDLASQLDTLLTQVQNQGAVPAEPSAEAPVSEAVEPTAVEAGEVPEAVAEASAEVDAPKPVASLSEDDLANQIQNLLNEVQNPGAVAQAGADTPAEEVGEAATESVEPTEVIAGTDAAAMDEIEDASAVSIDQIDAMLAESAAEAIEHGPAPETDIPPGTDEVLAAQAKAEEEAEARAKADRDAAEPTPVPVPVEVSAVEPEPIPVPVPVPAPAQAAEPEPVAVEPTPAAVGAGGASAQDVANELDNDSPMAGSSDDELAEAAFTEAVQNNAAEAGFDAEPVMSRSGLKKAEYALLMICSKVNKPLNRLSPEVRHSVGYVGVATTTLGLFMFLYGVMF